MLTRKDFKAIAEIIKEETSFVNPYFPFMYVKNLTDELAGYFKRENPKFDRERFLKACGL